MMAYGVRDGSVLPPSPFNFTDFVDDCRKDTGLPPRPFWIETEFGGYVSCNDIRIRPGRLLGWAQSQLAEKWPSVSGLLVYFFSFCQIKIYENGFFVSGYCECHEEIC